MYVINCVGFVGGDSRCRTRKLSVSLYDDDVWNARLEKVVGRSTIFINVYEDGKTDQFLA